MQARRFFERLGDREESGIVSIERGKRDLTRSMHGGMGHLGLYQVPEKAASVLERDGIVIQHLTTVLSEGW